MNVRGNPGARASETLHPGLKHALAGLCAALVACCATSLVEPAPEEPLAWRWLRVAADHPVRLALAVALAAFACAPGRRPAVDGAS